MPVRFSCSMVESAPSASSEAVKYLVTSLKYTNELTVSTGRNASEISVILTLMVNMTAAARTNITSVRTISISCS